MNFIDKASVEVAAGKGGDGALSFRKEKFVDRGGPDGGDGGKGGDVVFVASRNENTLANFRYQKELKAEDGGDGAKQKMHGKNGSDLVVKVPVGTVVTDGAGNILADLAQDGQRAVIAMGGDGGFGNAHFTSSTRQAPKFAEKGEAGLALSLRLELKMIADVGLVGLPNAGKSTLLSVISNARPEIADYPFTTIRPNLGVVDIDKNHSLLFADIPGLIEGAAAGKGLGDEFLRHVERTKVLVHLVDVASENVAADYKTIQKELAEYQINLSAKPQLVVLSKIDTVSEQQAAAGLETLQKLAGKNTVLAISSQAHKNLPQLLNAVQKTVTTEKARLEKLAEDSNETGLPIITLPDDKLPWQVAKAADGWQITGKKVEKFAARTDFSNEQSVQRLKSIMKKMGIMHELARQGAAAGDLIRIKSATLKY